MFTETIKKSEIKALSEYDYQWITRPDERLIPVSIIDRGESLDFEYDEMDLKPFEKIKEEDVAKKLMLLISLGRLEAMLPHYEFRLEPANVYYDVDGRTYIKFRDVRTETGDRYKEEFLREYKAIIASVLQSKYSYEDYMNGGETLLRKDRFLSGIYDCGTVDSVMEALKNEYGRILEERKKKYTEVRKGTIFRLRMAVIVLGVLSAASLAFGAYHLIYIEPYKDASILLHEAYTYANYPAAIAAMSGTAVDQMTTADKYLLATSYVRTENLTTEQKNNILSTLSVNDSGLRLDYWIYIGRGMTDNASDIAMQLSDDQLLLYSYMKALEMTETDVTLTGEEKQDRIAQINSAMSPLIGKYDHEDAGA